MSDEYYRGQLYERQIGGTEKRGLYSADEIAAVLERVRKGYEEFHPLIQ